VRQTCQILFLILWVALPLAARQREYVIGTGVSLIGGGDNNPRSLTGGMTERSRELRVFYGAYPGIALTSTGARSSVGLSYAFGFDRVETDPRRQGESHSATVDLSRDLGPQWDLSLSDTFQISSDMTTFNAFRGIATDPEQPGFLFDPVAAGLSARTNRAALALTRQTGPGTRLSFTGSHSSRKYGGENPFPRALSDQQNASAGVAYTAPLGVRGSWTAGYTAGYSDFRDFENVASHSASLGFSREIARDLTFGLSAGPSYVGSRGADGASYLGYNAAASLRHLRGENAFSLYASVRSGRPSGLGAVSDTRRAGLSFTRRARPIDLFVDVAAFDARGRLGNSARTRAISAAATVGYPFTDTLSLQVGGRYQRYADTAIFGFTQERLFASLRYDDPELWRFFR
jgi:outer membrane protein assembly factor BamA